MGVHIYGELELVSMQKWVWLLSLRSIAVPLPNCLLQSAIVYVVTIVDFQLMPTPHKLSIPAFSVSTVLRLMG